MKKNYIWLLMPLVSLLSNCVQRVDVDAELRTLVAAERAFAHASVTKGMRAAFLSYLADESIVFRPHPVAGKTWYQERPATPVLLMWEPTFAEISSGGDLGYTTGPWQFKPDSTAAQFSAFGHYVSVWKKNPDGKWRVVIDVGIEYAKPEASTGELTFPALRQRRNASSVNLEKERIKLLDTDRAFAHTSATQGVVAAFMAYAGEDIRFYRMNALPVIGKEKVRAVLSEKNGLLTWQAMAAELSRTADLGYTYGNAEFKQRADDNERVDLSYYLRIWRKQPDGAWKVVLDIDNPAPPAESD